MMSNPKHIVALTSRLRTGLARTVLGSVAMQVVHGVRCPVVVGPPPAPPSEVAP